MVDETETGAVETVAEPATVADTPAAPRSHEEIMGEVFDKMNPHRADDGRYASKTPAESAETATAEQTPDPAAPKVASKVEPLAAPEGWSDAGKAKWNRLPREVQQDILARATPQADPALAEKVKRYEPIGQILAEHRDTFARARVDEATGIRMLLAAQQELDRDAPAALQKLAQMYGVDLAKLTGAQTAEAAPSEGTDPNLQRVVAELNEVKGKLSRYEQQQHHDARTQAQQELEAFANEKDGDKPKRPHFKEVREEMARLYQASLQIGKPITLEAAYDSAVWANPHTRQRILDEKRQQDEERAQKEAEKKAAEAKRLKSLNVRGAQGTTPVKRTMEETMAAAYDRATGAS
jgi:hypothetical protein